MTSIRIRGIEDVNRVLQEIAPREAINLMRATTADLAKGIAKDAQDNAPVDQGDIKRGIKHKRARGDKNTVKAEVVANTNGTSFHWRFEEYGQGPSGVEVAMFLRALMKAKTEMPQRYLQSFTDKLIGRLARKGK
jgi:HK97 gp10 family phage protein